MTAFALSIAINLINCKFGDFNIDTVLHDTQFNQLMSLPTSLPCISVVLPTVGTLECRSAGDIAIAIVIVETNDGKDSLEPGTKGLVESVGLGESVGLVESGGLVESVGLVVSRGMEEPVGLEVSM